MKLGRVVVEVLTQRHQKQLNGQRRDKQEDRNQQRMSCLSWQLKLRRGMKRRRRKSRGIKAKQCAEGEGRVLEETQVAEGVVEGVGQLILQSSEATDGQARK